MQFIYLLSSLPLSVSLSLISLTLFLSLSPLHNIPPFSISHTSLPSPYMFLTSLQPLHSSTNTAILLTLSPLYFYTSLFLFITHLHTHPHKHKHTHARTPTAIFLSLSLSHGLLLVCWSKAFHCKGKALEGCIVFFPFYAQLPKVCCFFDGIIGLLATGTACWHRPARVVRGI